MKVMVSHYGGAIRMEHYESESKQDRIDSINKGTILISKRALSVNEVCERFGHIWDYLNSFYIPAVTIEKFEFVANSEYNVLESSYDASELGE
ncbi:MAG: hypothetical protein QW328_06975 [Nitrososphaerota archaeon]